MNITELNNASEIAGAKYQIEIWLMEKEQFELYCDGCRLLTLTRDNFDFTVEFGKLIFSYWDETRAESWRVINYQIEPELIRFNVLLPFSTAGFLFELALPTALQSYKLATIRRAYLALLTRLIEQHWPSMRVVDSKIGRNDRFGYGAATARLLLRNAQEAIAAVGVSERDDADAWSTLLGQGVIWFYNLRKRLAPITIDRLILFSPTKGAGRLAERLTLIGQQRLKISLYAVDEANTELNYFPPFDQGDLGLRLANSSRLPAIKRAGNQIGSAGMQMQIEWIRSLAPDAIELLPTGINREVKLAINGLEVARIKESKNLRVEFGLTQRQLLTKENREEFITLVQDVARSRCAGVDQRQQSYYQAGEAWLESLLRRNIQLLDVDLLPNYTYSQVPAIKQHNQRYIDLMAMRKDGQLVVIELKICEKMELPFQGLDYWLRVEWYRRRGDFVRLGYFPGELLKDAPAWLYLVAPRLRLHSSFKLFSRLIDSQVPVFCIAINDNWRDGLKVDWCERMN